MTKLIAEQVPGYTYGTDAVAPSPITLQELEALKVSVGFTEEDQRLSAAGRRSPNGSDSRDRTSLAQRHYRWHTEPGAALTLTRRRTAA